MRPRAAGPAVETTIRVCEEPSRNNFVLNGVTFRDSFFMKELLRSLLACEPSLTGLGRMEATCFVSATKAQVGAQLNGSIVAAGVRFLQADRNGVGD